MVIGAKDPKAAASLWRDESELLTPYRIDTATTAYAWTNVLWERLA